MSIDKSDRKLLIWAGVFMVLVVVALAVVSPDEEESGVPSTYSAQARGAKAAFLLLQDAGYKVYTTIEGRLT
jgi:type II secretory pathway component PulM